MMIAAIKNVLSETIHDPSKHDWSLQGFGMFRLYISKEVRLHVWDMRFAWNTTTIHTHPWNFQSKILSGVIIDRTFVELDNGWGPHEKYYPYQKQQIICGPGGGKDGTPVSVKLGIYQTNVFKQDDSYIRKANDIHESIAKPGTVTLVTRKFLEDTEHAYVYYPYDQDWKSAEPRRATDTEVISMASLALEKWDEL
jgi:hypothetical protein